MKTRLVPIGNSRGVRLPKPLIEQAGLGDDVELQVRQGAIIITPIAARREGWAEAAQLMHQRQEDRLLDAAPTEFETAEWEW